MGVPPPITLPLQVLGALITPANTNSCCWLESKFEIVRVVTARVWFTTPTALASLVIRLISLKKGCAGMVKLTAGRLDTCTAGRLDTPTVPVTGRTALVTFAFTDPATVAFTVPVTGNGTLTTV